ncbi:hypothetical protein GCM10027589_14620 [Actinocorallia lasiicapitis]
MNGDGQSEAADLVMLPIAFLIVLAVATAVFFLVRKFGPQSAAAPEQRVAVQVPAPRSADLGSALRTLHDAGVDTDELLGPWLADARGYAHRDGL